MGKNRNNINDYSDSGISSGEDDIYLESEDFLKQEIDDENYEKFIKNRIGVDIDISMLNYSDLLESKKTYSYNFLKISNYQFYQLCKLSNTTNIHTINNCIHIINNYIISDKTYKNVLAPPLVRY